MSTSLRLLAVAMLLTFAAASCTDSSSNDQNNNNNNNNNPGDDPDNDPDDTGIPVLPVDILTSAKYKKLVINFAVVEGMSFSNKAALNALDFLKARINKDLIQIRVYDSIPSIGKAAVTAADLKAFEKKYRKKTIDGDTLFIWVPVVDAEFSPDPAPDIIFGSAYGSSAFAIFGSKLNQYTLPDMVSRFTLETFVFEHEFCHLLGLTNGGTNMVTAHQDTDHGHHCSNTSCMMYYRANETIKLTDILDNAGTSDVIPTLDANCIADLQAAGGK